MHHFVFSETMVFHIPFRGLGRFIKSLFTAPKSPEGDLKLQLYCKNLSLKNTTLYHSYYLQHVILLHFPEFFNQKSCTDTYRGLLRDMKEQVLNSERAISIEFNAL